MAADLMLLLYRDELYAPDSPASGTVEIDDVDDIVLASVVPALSEAVEAVARRRGLGLVVASAGIAPLSGRAGRELPPVCAPPPAEPLAQEPLWLP